MKLTKNRWAASLGLIASTGVLSVSQAEAAPVDQVTVRAQIAEVMSIEMGSSLASMRTTAAQLQSGITSSESALVPITIETNVGGQVVVSAKSLVPADGKQNAITPADLRLQVFNTGGGSAITRYYRKYDTLLPGHDQAPARIWTQSSTTGLRTKTFTVKFQHRNANLYKGRTQPYINTVQFTITKGG